MPSSNHTHEICPECWGDISPDAAEQDKCNCKQKQKRRVKIIMTIKYGSPALYGKLLDPPLSKKQVNVYLNTGRIRGAQQMPLNVEGTVLGNWIIPINPIAPDPRRKRETA